MQGLLYLYTIYTKENVLITVSIGVFFFEPLLLTFVVVGCKFTPTTAGTHFTRLYLHLLHFVL